MPIRILNDAALPGQYGEAKVVYATGVPIESSALIENLLLGEDDNIVAALYESEELDEYFKDNGIEKLDFGGGEFGITASMLVEVPKSVIASVKFQNGRKLGAARAKTIHDLCQGAMDSEPYY